MTVANSTAPTAWVKTIGNTQRTLDRAQSTSPKLRPTMVSLCQVNISGLSQQSTIALDHYVSDRRISVLALQETYRVPPTNVFQNMLTFGVPHDRGVTLSVNKSLHPQEIDSLETPNVAAVFVIATVNSRPIMFASVYISPDANLSLLLNSIQRAWSYCRANGVPVLHVLGDFNSRGISWGDRIFDGNGTKLELFCNKTGARILSPRTNTFLCANGGSVIDLSLVFGNPARLIEDPWTDEDEGLSLFTGAPGRGHVPVITTIGSNRINAPRNRVWNYDEAEWEKWTWHLESNLPEAETEVSDEDPFDLYNTLLQLIQEASELFIPKKTICRYSKPYWTEELSQLSKHLQAAQRRYQFRRTFRNKGTLDVAKQVFKETLIKSKNKWIHERLSGLNVTDTRVFWKRYRSMFLVPEENFIGCLEENGVLKHSTIEKEDLLFDTFFGGKHLRNKNFDENHYRDVCRQVEDILLEDRSEEEETADELNGNVSTGEVIEAMVSQEWSGKSSDGEGIHPVILKHFGNRAISFLARLFTRCLETSTWPWRNSTVSFIKKSGKKSYLKPGSFRPITISSYIGKLLERVIDKRLRKHCYQEDILDEEQEGFLPARSTTRYLYRLLATLHENRRRKATAFLLLIDFEKAFDSVPIPCLILKLHRVGICGRILKLLNHMLSNRSVKLRINGALGGSRVCGSTGLPQGAVLSPLLFIVYIADLLITKHLPAEVRGNTETFKFADDGTVLVTGSQADCEKSMEIILQYIDRWCKLWRLVVNCDKDKTEVLVVRPRTTNLVPVAPLKRLFMGTTEITYTDSSKVLGVYLDGNLDFKKHAAYTLQKCWYSWSKLSGGTRRSEGTSSSALALLFKTVVLTKLFYAAPLWLKDRMDDFKDLLARAKLKILGAQSYSSTVLTDLLTTIPPLKLSLEVLTTKFVLKGLNAEDTMTAKLFQIESEPSHKFFHHIVSVKKYLEWKSAFEENPDTTDVAPSTASRRYSRRTCDLMAYDPNNLLYTKSDMEIYTCRLWDEEVKISIESLIRTDEFTIEPPYSVSDMKALVDTEALLAFPLLNRSLDRATTSTILDFVHGHCKRFQDFAFSSENYDRTSTVPGCVECGLLPDSTYHKLFECIKAGPVSALREQLQSLSAFEVNFHIPLLFSRDNNLKRKFRSLVEQVAEACSFDDNLLV